MNNKKIMDLCLFCVKTPSHSCIINHEDWVSEIYLSNVLSEKEIDGVNMKCENDDVTLEQKNEDFYGYIVYTLYFKGQFRRFVTEKDANHVIDNFIYMKDEENNGVGKE